MKNYLCLLVLTFIINANAQVVSNNTELQNAINSASAGSTILLANGVWNDVIIDINKTGTAANPIVIRSQNVGQVFLEGNPRVSLGGAYIFFEGFVFQNPSGLVSSGGRIEPIIEFRDSGNNECNNCTVTNIEINNFNGTVSQEEDVFKWIIIYGQNNDLSHSSFIGKHGVGSIINDNRNDTNPDYSKIHHNYFGSRTPVGEVNALNDQDAIRIGNSSTSLTDSFTEIYDNLFHDWAGEVEIISVKSGKNKLYNNTFSDYSGTLTLRHGNGSEVYNNYFFANNNIFSGGIRVIGEDHKIYNNYIEGVNSEKPDGSSTKTTGAINITNGRPSSAPSGYFQVKNTTIINNTFVNCDYGFRVGTNVGGDLTLAPENVIMANNIMLNTSVNAVDEQTAPVGTSTYEGNITQNGIWDLTNGVDNNQTVASGLLTAGTDFYMLPVGSAAIDASIGTYTFLTTDILGSVRPALFDAGAEEYGGSGMDAPYKVGDVGIQVGFLSAPSPYLSVSTNEINFNNEAGSLNFDVNSNISWTVSDDAGWLSLDTSSGSNGATVMATVIVNSSGTERTATVTVTESGGSLSASLNVVQSADSFTPIKITGVTVTGVGTQDPNIPENTLDENASTRWSANSEDGSAYLTYDLQCQKTVTSVNIYFHKGNTRTSSFKIATSTDGINFNDETAVLTSSGTTVGFEEFVITPNSTVQYVRILGYGNSEASGWNSYEEVEIFGNDSCATLSLEDNLLNSNQVMIYPIPTNDGYLNIKSNNRAIGAIKIFDIQGKLLHTQKINLNSAKIDVSNFSNGIYIFKTDNSINRFVVE